MCEKQSPAIVAATAPPSVGRGLGDTWGGGQNARTGEAKEQAERPEYRRAGRADPFNALRSCCRNVRVPGGLLSQILSLLARTKFGG
jgi:hypothetical protein